MVLSNLSELRAFLASVNAFPKKGLSQNFLIDGNIVQKILKEAKIAPGDRVLEIGPGPGVLTEAFREVGAEVVAVEKDSVFAQALTRFEGVEVYASDIMEFDFSLLTSPPYKVVSNLPYHLTAPILARLSPERRLFSSLTVMVQEEVARRMVAQAKTKDYGSFSLYLQFYADVSYAFKVSRHCFYPAPNVDSAIVTLVLKTPPLEETEGFHRFVRRAFQQRRKMLKSVFKEFPLGQWLEEIGENPQSRPEDLSLEIFCTLFKKTMNLS